MRGRLSDQKRPQSKPEAGNYPRHRGVVAWQTLPVRGTPDAFVLPCPAGIIRLTFAESLTATQSLVPRNLRFVTYVDSVVEWKDAGN